MHRSTIYCNNIAHDRVSIIIPTLCIPVKEFITRGCTCFIGAQIRFPKETFRILMELYLEPTLISAYIVRDIDVWSNSNGIVA